MFRSLPRQMPVLTSEEKEKEELAMWAWNSHYWIEYQEGYYKCKYCGKHTTNTAGYINFTLCPKNPIVIRDCFPPKSEIPDIRL